MDDDDLKQLFDSMDIPEPDSEQKKIALNLAVASFEQQQKENEKKSEKSGQGFLSWFRLIRQEQTQRRDSMSFSESFSKRKLVYGGLATACIALMIFTVPALNTAQQPDAAVIGVAVDAVSGAEDTTALAKKSAVVKEEALLPEGKLAVAAQSAPAPVSPPASGNSIMGQLNSLVGTRSTAGNFASAERAMPMLRHHIIADTDVAVMQQQEFGRDKFTDFDVNPVKQVAQEPVSTFSIDVDTASYAFVRQSLDNGILPQKDAVRVEEMINYFDYDYAAPKDKAVPFASNISVYPSPWNKGRQLVHIGIRGYDIEKTARPKSNLVFLLDVSGSMNEPKKLPLVKQSISMLLDTLGKDDKVSIVVYAGAAGTVLEPTSATEKGKILQALQNLDAGGGTAGAEGIRTAYALAEANFDKDAVNRVVLATDGDFNVGITNQEELQDFVERKRDSGIFLSVIGFGQGNYNDAMMQTLAQNGNGVAAYIDTINEARKVLVEEASSTLFPIAKDVKIQVEFNPKRVAEYRLVGYETRALKTEDFNNDKVDAGDIGAGHTVTAIYEITPVDSAQKSIDASRYADQKKEDVSGAATVSDELAFLKIRYKLPDAKESKLMARPITQADESAALSGESAWAVAVASFAQMLKGGQYTGAMTYDDILQLAEKNRGADPFGYRAEFITMIHKVKTAQSLPAQP